ncbi:MAG: hypothetical protein F6J87_26795 [Spirulina sp. SIO3F2]|nr:hypothetical protein [Spirulina sp. SIO3F2]
MSGDRDKEKSFTDDDSRNSNNDSKFLVEIYQEDGTSWQAEFKSGDSEFSNVYQHPNREDLIVVSGGQGYVVNPETQQKTETFGGEITHAIELRSAHQILFKSGHQFIVYNVQGLLWKQIIPMLHELRQLNDEGRSILTGEQKATADADWQPFWMNTDTGQTYSEKYDCLKIVIERNGIKQRPWWKIW